MSDFSEDYTLRNSRGIAIIVLPIFLLVTVYQIAYVIELLPNLFPSDFKITTFIDRLIWFGFLLAIQIGTIVVFVGTLRQKIVLSRKSLYISKIRSKTNVPWSTVWSLKITFILPRYQRHGWITGKKGIFEIEANLGGQTMRYTQTNMSPDQLNSFLKALTHLTKRAPKVVSPYNKETLSEKQVWQWG